MIEMPYMGKPAEGTLARGTCLATLNVRDTPALPNIDDTLRHALANPIGLDQPLSKTIQPGETVAIVVSDSFRQTRVDQILPVLVNELVRAGVDDNDIAITFATGVHRGPTPDEQIAILGETMTRRFEGLLFAHDAEDSSNLIHVGDTSRGTRVELNKRVHESDRIIATGAIVFHYFGGFGGGRKSILPGIASTETIAQNHAMNLAQHGDQLDPAVDIGVTDGNPVAEDMIEGAKLTHVDCIVNTVLNAQGEIAGIFAGDMEQAHTAGAAFARGMYSTPIDVRADLVIAASSDTRNFVQTHKALYNAYQAVKPEGRIVLLAPCPEGLGGERFSKWLALGDRAAIIKGLRKQSEINGQTALSTIEKASITILVTEMPEKDVALLGARKADTLQAALDLALSEIDTPNPTYYQMPAADHTVPFLET